MSEQCLTIVLSTKPLQKLTGSDRTGRQTGAQDYVLSQADALTKKEKPRANFCSSNKPPGKVLTLLSIYTAEMRQCLEINKSSGTNKLVNGPRKSRDISTEYEHKFHSGEVKR